MGPETERLWTAYLCARASIGSTADHDPQPASLSGAWTAADRAASALRQHLQEHRLTDMLTDPTWRPHLLALGQQVSVGTADVDDALHRLRPRD